MLLPTSIVNDWMYAARPPREGSQVKYYVYISASKVGMLYPQIPSSFLKGAEAELKVNIGVISTGIKARGPEDVKELPAQIPAIESYLRNQKQIGTVDEPRA
jgi:hypothetical protein